MIKGISRAALCLLFFVAPAHAQSNSTPVMGTIIEENGSTSLVEVGSNFFFYPVGQFSGPELSYNGTPFVAGQFGAWTPIGVEQTASGYEVAWKVTGADEYTVWNTDSSGNYVSNAIGGVSGSSVALELFEPGFQQDLNGDGVIGVPSVIQAGATSLVQVGSNFFFYPVGGSSGPELSYNGTPFVAGQFGGWTPIGVEQTASGYEVAWNVTGADEYTVWNTDSSGNYVSNAVWVVSGSSVALELFEPGFQQDLNGDGLIGVPSVIEAGATSLVQVGSNFFFYPVGGSSGPELSYNGTPFVAGQFGGWTPIGVAQTASGYEVAWKVTGADEYTVWNTDSSGNYVSNAIGGVSGSSVALELFEPGFQQDLNGDGVIGVPSVIQAGATSLVQVGSNFFFYPVGGSSGPELSYNGTPFVAGQFGGWTPIGVEQTASGYEVAWNVTGADEYTVWNTDSSGNYVSNAVWVVSGSSVALELFEPGFQQDLNGDGLIGVPSVIEAGATSLVQVGSNFFFYPVGGSSGPELSYNGTPFVAGQFGGWTPIGVEQTASGYEVAWKVTGADEYTVWNTDSSGNYVSNAIGGVSGSSVALELFEPGFQQDLNGDGVIGVPSVIQAGATSLVQVGSNFFFYPVGGSSGPELSYNGTPFVAGQFGGWTPIGVAQTASGYEVAWKVTGADQYTVWNTDSSGNYTSNAIGVVSGSSVALESLEPSFQQDLNGDGLIGVLVEAKGSTSLVQVGSNFFFYPVGGSSGPELSYNGTPFVAGQFGAWTPIGVEQTASGYEVAWKVTGADQYTVWNTDSSGNYTSNAIGVVSGSSVELESLEPSFQQDLNGDGVIGVLIEAKGSTSLVEVGNNFFFYPVGGSSGPELSYNGTPFVAGQFGAWTPIGVGQTASGYEVAWKVKGADQDTVWNTHRSGNYTSNAIGVVSGSSVELESLEPSFQQDLN